MNSVLSKSELDQIRNTLVSPLPGTTQVSCTNNSSQSKLIKKRKKLTFPWWFIFIAYGLSLIIVLLSVLFIIARGIEFGDMKTRKWLTSSMTGFFSSILLTQPLKVTMKFQIIHLSKSMKF